MWNYGTGRNGSPWEREKEKGTQYDEGGKKALHYKIILIN